MYWYRFTPERYQTLPGTLKIFKLGNSCVVSKTGIMVLYRQIYASLHEFSLVESPDVSRSPERKTIFSLHLSSSLFLFTFICHTLCLFLSPLFPHLSLPQEFYGNTFFSRLSVSVKPCLSLETWPIMFSHHHVLSPDRVYGKRREEVKSCQPIKEHKVLFLFIPVFEEMWCYRLM